MSLFRKIHQQRKRVLFLASIFLFCFFSYASSSTVISDKALEKQGITRQEFVEIVDNYYKYSNPDKLMACFRAVLSEPTLVEDKVNFNIFMHEVIVAAHHDPFLFKQLEEEKRRVSGQEQATIDKILKEASNFISPNPDSVSHINDLWSEFIVTGDKTPILKVINVLKLSEGKPSIVSDTAFNSLRTMSGRHAIVLEIVNEAERTSFGSKKSALQSILNEKVKAYHQYGYMKEGYFGERIKCYTDLIQKNPGDYANYFMRGLTYANNHHFDAALPDFLKALDLKSDLPIANNYVGFIYLDQRKYDNAEPYLIKAIEQAPNFSKPYFNLARLYKFRNDLNKALEYINKAMDRQPYFYEAYFTRAEIYFYLKEYHKALEDLVKGFKQSQKRIRPLKRNGIVANKRGEF